MTRNSIEMLKAINRKIIFVPITTRTKEQYARINMDIGEFTYALVCNGGFRHLHFQTKLIRTLNLGNYSCPFLQQYLRQKKVFYQDF